MRDLPADTEPRRGNDEMVHRFAPGWAGPIVLVVQARGARTLWSDASYHALLAVMSALAGDPRSGRMIGEQTKGDR